MVSVKYFQTTCVYLNKILFHLNRCSVKYEINKIFKKYDVFFSGDA